MISLFEKGGLLKSRNAGGRLITSQNRQLQRRQFSPGGYLVGPSHEEGGIDAIIDEEEPIEVEGGEFIIRKSSVDYYGLDFLHRLNRGEVDQGVSDMRQGGRVNPAMRHKRNLQSYRPPQEDQDDDAGFCFCCVCEGPSGENFVDPTCSSPYCYDTGGCYNVGPGCNCCQGTTTISV
jgi:hypothetical protein